MQAESARGQTALTCFSGRHWADQMNAHTHTHIEDDERHRIVAAIVGNAGYE